MKINPGKRDLDNLFMHPAVEVHFSNLPKKMIFGNVSPTCIAKVPEFIRASVMEAVTQLHENLARIVEMESAKGQAVVQHYTAVSHI